MRSAAALMMSPGITPQDRRATLPNPFELNRRINASSMPARAKTLAIAIFDHARYGASACTASDERLGIELGGLTARQVQRLRQIIEADGWTETDRLGTSKFAYKRIRLGPACFILPRIVPGQQTDQLHLDIPGRAPRYRCLAKSSSSGELEKETTPRTRGTAEAAPAPEPGPSSSFQSSDPESRGSQPIQARPAPEAPTVARAKPAANPAATSTLAVKAERRAAQTLDEAVVTDLAVKLMILWGFSDRGARAEIAQECHRFADTDPAVVLTWFAHLVGQAEKLDPKPKSGYVHGGLVKIHRKGGLKLPPPPEQLLRQRRARETLDELARYDRFFRRDGEVFRFHARDPENARPLPGYLVEAMKEFRPEILAVLADRERRASS